MPSAFFARVLAFFTLSAAVFVALPAQAADPIYTPLLSSKAVSGYDSVAYHTEGKPVEGDDAYKYEWMGATWLFASSANRDLFIADPERYAPQYGGYCAYAVSQGNTASADPERWKIVDGKLYLNYNQAVQEIWEKDIPGYISQADANWPAVLEK